MRNTRMQMTRLAVLALFLTAGRVLPARAAEPGSGPAITSIVVEAGAHPAALAAARMMARALGVPESGIRRERRVGVPAPGMLVLDSGEPSKEQVAFVGRDPQTVKLDGYLVRFDGDRALVFGRRPRSLLYAAGDVGLWKGRSEGTYVREPAFETRDVNLGGTEDVATLVARTGANLVFERFDADFVTLRDAFPRVYDHLAPADRAHILREKEAISERAARIAAACHAADVDFYPFLYGNDMARWSPALMNAVYAVYPGVRGVRAPHSWEKASLNPALPQTWKLIDAFVTEFASTLHGDGLMATFWDDYGLYSQDSLSVAAGLNRFDAELEKTVGVYYRALERLGQPLIVRTWSSGRAHWVTLRNNQGELEHQFVHAPGYGGFSGTRYDLWKGVIENVPAAVTLQTKVYFSDCFPDARFNPLIGKTGAHPQIVEYQMAGQTTGNYWLPAANVEHTRRTLNEAHRRMGAHGGTSAIWGGTHQVHYHLFDDIVNSVNMYAWRAFSWDLDADPDSVWSAWAVPIYGERAAPHVVAALKLSEPVVDGLFTTLGLGWDTNSGFPGTIYRREVLLTYTNRFYLPEYRQYLEPTLENVRRVAAQKDSVLRDIDRMFAELEKARPDLTPAQYDELRTRFDWLRAVARENRELEVAYWRFRYLRHLFALRDTDPEQMARIADAYDEVRQSKADLFRFRDDQRFSAWDRPLGQIDRIRRIGLGDPEPLMKEIYEESSRYVEEITGPTASSSRGESPPASL
jgi:hypothetical protein